MKGNAMRKGDAEDSLISPEQAKKAGKVWCLSWDQ